MTAALDRFRLAVLAARMLPWALSLPLLKRRVSFARLVRLVAADRDREQDPAEMNRIRRAAHRVVRRRERDVNCLELSLVTFRFLGLAGAKPVIAIGTRRDGSKILGHAWVLLDGAMVHDPSESMELFSRGRFVRSQMAASSNRNSALGPSPLEAHAASDEPPATAPGDDGGCSRTADHTLWRGQSHRA